MGMNHSSNISFLDLFYIFRAPDIRINIRRGRIILIEMTGPILCIINRINYNKSHAHIPEIPKQRNSTVELPKRSINPKIRVLSKFFD